MEVLAVEDGAAVIFVDIVDDLFSESFQFEADGDELGIVKMVEVGV